MKVMQLVLSQQSRNQRGNSGREYPQPYGQFWMIRRSTSAQTSRVPRVQTKGPLRVHAISARSSSHRAPAVTTKFCSRLVTTAFITSYAFSQTELRKSGPCGAV